MAWERERERERETITIMIVWVGMGVRETALLWEGRGLIISPIRGATMSVYRQTPIERCDIGGISFPIHRTLPRRPEPYLSVCCAELGNGRRADQTRSSVMQEWWWRCGRLITRREGDNIKTTNGMEMNCTHAFVYFGKWLCTGVKGVWGLVGMWKGRPWLVSAAASKSNVIIIFAWRSWRSWKNILSPSWTDLARSIS